MDLRVLRTTRGRRMRAWLATVNTDLANPSPLCIVIALLDIVAELPYPRRCRRTALGLRVAREVFPREEGPRILLILLVWRLEHHRADNWALSHSTRYRMQLQECTCMETLERGTVTRNVHDPMAVMFCLKTP
ncbi:hypothetical protein FOXYSP1_17739 [Fusarium oxysporum f. sp. phaseoli]